jgi:hypothetical protein
MLTKHNLPEMDVQDKGALVAKHEKDGRAVEYNPSIHEADAATPQGDGVALISVSHTNGDTSRFDGVSSALRTEDLGYSSEQEEARLKIMKDRIEEIRAEKARLERIQELEELEEQTNRDIIGSGSGSRSGRIRELGDEEENVQRDILESQRRLYGSGGS